MKFAICVVLLLSVVSANQVPFTLCGSGTITPQTVDITPFPPQPGNDITVTASGSVAEDLIAGAYEIDIAYLGITLDKLTGDLCTLSPSLKCPQKAGPITITYTTKIPSIAPKGSYNVKITANKPDSSALLCISVDFSMSSVSNNNSIQSYELFENVNRLTNLWKAGPSRRFWRSTKDDVKSLCGVLAGGPKLQERIYPMNFLNAVDIPESFDSRTEWGSICPSVKDIRDQGACGSCWAVAAAAAMTDRLCIQSQGAQNLYLSEQDLVSCCSFTCGFGCSGGFPAGAWNYFTTNGLVTGGPYGSKQGCYPYEIASCDHHVNGTRGPCGQTQSTPACKRTCQNGADFTTDKRKESKSYSVPSNVKAIQTEIMQHGPVEATFTVFEDFVSYKSGVYHHVTGGQLGGHAVKMIGWGTENGAPYWLIANSWNEGWGDQGLFKILQGQDECGIESGITAGII